MTIVLVAVLGAIWLGAVVAVSARDPRTAGVGVAIALATAALLADPLPPPALLGSLVVAGLLAAALVRTAVPGRVEAAGPGWPGEALLAAAGGFAGLGIATALAAAELTLGLGQGSGGPAAPPPSGFDPFGATAMAATAAGALLAITLGPAALPRPGPRHAAALVLLVEAVLLLRIALAGPPVELEVVAWASLLVAVGAAGAVLARLVPATPAEATPADAPGRRRS